MLKSFVKVLMVVAGLLWASTAVAIGFGSATVSSALGQPLKVEIALKDVDSSHASGLTAQLASPNAFQAAGIDYPYHLSKLKFRIVTHGGGAYIEIRSTQPVNDSFINLLVELSWNSGKLLREYTFLLDPPDYKATMPKAEEVAPIEPVIVPVPPPEAPSVAPLPPEAPAAAQSAQAPASAPTAAQAATEGAGKPATTNPPALPGAQAASAQQPAAGKPPEVAPIPPPAKAPVATTKPKASPPPFQAHAEKAHAKIRKKRARATIRVKRGDNLTKIASRVMEPDVTLEQMLVALYRANVRQFDGRNMNRIRAGKILRMPSQDAFDHLSNREAVKIIRVQTANWNAYRQKLASYGTTVSRQPKRRAGGKISTSVLDKTPVKKPGNNGTLKISKGAGGKAPAAEQAAADKQAVAANKKRIAQLEQQIKEMNKVQALKQKQGQKQSVLTMKSTVQPPSTAASAPAAAQPKPKTAPKPAHKLKRNFMPPPAPKAQPSFLADLLSPITESDYAKDYPFLQNPIYVAAGLGAILLLIIGAVVSARGRRGGGRAPKKKKIRIGKK